jgi:hypothetical protein
VRWMARVLPVVLVLLAPRPLLACVCSETGSVGDELQSSGAVFLGRIVALRIETLSLEDTTAERMQATFKVERRWKGPQQSKLEVWTCGDQVSFCTCGVDFKLGERYLVFADGQPLGTASCNRTRVAGEAEAIIAELDKLSPAAKAGQQRDEADGPTMPRMTPSSLLISVLDGRNTI